MKKQMNRRILLILFLFLILLWSCSTAPPINPDAALVSITVSPKTIPLSIGESQAITSITASYNTGPDASIPLEDPRCTYSSYNSAIASVSKGIITGVAVGRTTIQVRYTEGSMSQEDTIDVTVSSTNFPINNLTQNTGHFTIQAALDLAQSNDTIQVDKGTFKESITFPSGKMIILESKDGPDKTIIRGDNNSSTLSINSSLTGTTLRGFTITHHSADNGRGILINKSGNLIIDKCSVSGNTCSPSDGDGGGICNSGNLSITSSTISTNSTASRGGGIVNDGTLTITESTISGNDANDYGGGLWNCSGTLSITSSTISYNSANNVGGGVFLSGAGIINIGGSHASDTSHFNTFTDNCKIGYAPSAGQHICDTNGDCHSSYPHNYYIPSI